jgi:hypothetical protein
VRGVDARLADPPNAQWREGAKEFLRLVQVRRDVVVHEKEQFLLILERLDLGQDVVNGPACLRGVEDGLHGAEVAFEMATAAGFDQPDGQITLATKDGTVGLEASERRAARLTVASLQAPVARVVDDLRPELLRFAADDGFRVTCHFVRAKRRVEAAHHDRHAPLAVFGGDLVGAPGGVSLDTQRDQIAWLVERNGLHPVVVKTHLDVFGRQAGHRRGGQRLHLPGADVALARSAPDAGMDDGQTH